VPTRAGQRSPRTRRHTPQPAIQPPSLHRCSFHSSQRNLNNRARATRLDVAHRQMEPACGMALPPMRYDPGAAAQAALRRAPNAGLVSDPRTGPASNVVQHNVPIRLAQVVLGYFMCLR
jgi:hypothetical protein